jgi:hypothetical protein
MGIVQVRFFVFCMLLLLKNKWWKQVIH